jgi:PhoD-like phosphatase
MSALASGDPARRREEASPARRRPAETKSLSHRANHAASTFPTLVMIAAILVVVPWNDPLRCVRAADYELSASRPEQERLDASTDAPIRSLAFGSCHKLKYAQERLASSNLWQSILNATTSPPDAWIWTGDAVYPPTKGIAPLDELAHEYHAMKSSPHYAAFVRQVPLVLGTYDDHDYGGNDYGRHMPAKRERANLFYDFLGLAKPKDGREGVYYSATWGRPPNQLKLIVLDTRFYRDDHCLVSSWATKLPVLGAGLAAAIRWIVAGTAPARWCDDDIGGRRRTVLGDAQWSWLERELRESEAALHVVVSSIQLLTTNPAMESWGQFPSEQRRMLNLLAPKRPGLVVLSGDVHHAEILNVSGVVEVTSSGLTHDCTGPFYGFLCEPILNTFASNRRSPSDYYAGRNFGHISIDWNTRSMVVNVFALSGRGADSAERSEPEPVLSTGDVIFGNDNELSQPFHASDLAPCMDGHLQTRLASILLALLIASCLASYQPFLKGRSKR